MLKATVTGAYESIPKVALDRLGARREIAGSEWHYGRVGRIVMIWFSPVSTMFPRMPRERLVTQVQTRAWVVSLLMSVLRGLHVSVFGRVRGNDGLR